MRQRIYADTSAIAGCLDEEFSDASSRLMALFASGEFVLVRSDLTLRELGKAPDEVQKLLDQVPDNNVEIVSLTEEAAGLAQEYLRVGVVGPKMRVDAEHIAVATVARVDVLVSWNFKHIVNLRRIQAFNSVNGLAIPFLRSERRGRCCLMSSQRPKTFDAVELMRSIRDQLVRETEGMTVADEIRSLSRAQFGQPALRRLAERAAQQRHAAGGASRRG